MSSNFANTGLQVCTPCAWRYWICNLGICSLISVLDADISLQLGDIWLERWEIYLPNSAMSTPKEEFIDDNFLLSTFFRNLCFLGQHFYYLDKKWALY